MSRESFESRYDKSRLRRWAGGIYPDEYSDPQVQLDWCLWQAAQADAYERAAKVCETHYAGPISAVIFEHEHETAQLLAGFIRALAKEAT